MATETLSIEIREDGTRIVSRNIAGIGQASQKSHGSVLTLQNALKALAGSLVIREVLGYANAFTTLQNRLRVVTNSTLELEQATQALYEVSLRTRSNFRNTAELYSRVSLATRDMGLSQSQTVQFTERLNKAILLSGATSAEASAGLIQFSQGLASGALRGDELRSVLEQLPAVADVIANSMGITRGALRSMGEQGLITTEQVIAAFEKAGSSLDRRFLQIVWTVPQALENLRTSLTNVIGRLDVKYQVTQKLARAIDDFAQQGLPELVRELERLAPLVATVTASYVAFNAAMLITGSAASGTLPLLARMRVAVLALNAALLANPIALVVAAIAALITWLTIMHDKIKVTENGVATLGDVMAVLWERIGEGIDWVAKKFSSLLSFLDNDFLNGMANIFRSIANMSFGDFLTTVAISIDSVIGMFKGMMAALRVVLTGFGQLLKDAITYPLVHELNLIEKRINSVIEGINTVSPFEDMDPVDFVDAPEWTFSFGQFGRDIGAAFNEGFSSTTGARDFVKDLLDDAEKRAKDRLANTKPVFVPPLFGEQEDRSDLLTPRMLLLRDINRELDEQGQFMNRLNHEREVENGLLQIKERMLDKGFKLSEGEEIAFRNRLRNLQVLEAEGQLLDDAMGKQYDMNTQLQAYNNIIARSPGLQSVLRATILEANVDILNDHTTTQDLILAKYEDTLRRIAALRDANVISEQQANQAIATATVNANAQRLQGFQDFFSGMAVLARSENKKLAAIGKAAAITQATIDGVLAVQKALASAPPPANYALAAAAGAVAAANVATIASSTPAFAKGGSFMVGGQGGTDSQLVNFKASPNERVTIETPKQVRERYGGNKGGNNSSYEISIDATDPGAEGRIRSMIQDEMVPQIIATAESRTIATMRRRSMS